MKTTKKTTLTVIFILCAFLWFSPATVRAAVTDPATTGALWTASFSDSYFMGTSMTSTPVIDGEMVYVVNRDTMYALDAVTGKIKYFVLLPARMNSVCDPVLEGDCFYIPLSGGRITCINVRNRSVLWTSELIVSDSGADFQTLGRLFAYGDYLYAGVWAASNRTGSDGVFFCLDKKTGQALWKYRNADQPAGFYWNRAAVCHNRVFFTDEKGTLVSHSLTEDTVYETRELTDGGELRNGLLAADEDSLYTVSKNGVLIRIRLSGDGRISAVDTASLFPDETRENKITCTSTPSVYGDRLYVGCAYDGYGYVCVMDKNTLRPIYQAKGPKAGEIKSSPLILPCEDTDTVADGHDKNANNSDVNIYVTANENTGSLYLLSDDKNKTEGTLQRLFTPYSAKQYCLANVVASEDGLLYYSNDSGTLFAIGETLISADLPKSEAKKKRALLQDTTKLIRDVLIQFTLGQFR